MNRTFTPSLPPGVLPRLVAYAQLFRPDFPLARQADWSLVYLRGLLQDGERKSIEPLVGRVDLPPQLRAKNPDQCLQNFVNQADWDEQAVWRRYRARMAESFADAEAVFVIDDTTFPKQGRPSVGVQRQHCGALGKKANCQAAVSVHYAAPAGHCPLAMRLYFRTALVPGNGRSNRPLVAWSLLPPSDSSRSSAGSGPSDAQSRSWRRRAPSGSDCGPRRTTCRVANAANSRSPSALAPQHRKRRAVSFLLRM